MAETDLKEQLIDWSILPPAKGTCQECGVVHAPEAPHNKDSLIYQYTFAKNNGRWPTWADASAHCTEEVREMLKGVLKEHSVNFE
ncbi:hypothetical protein [Vibrio sp. YQ_11]|uniref:hypothetical protein n=1 Tax=unclassified Vibrio TaxID=2614977 RepID=UPI00370A8891